MSGVRDTVVLPLAGAGSRLGLPIAKELVPLGPGRVALDHTLELLAPHADRLRLVAVLGEGREATWRHLSGRCHVLGLPLAAISQDPSLPDSTGAVMSAGAWFGAATAVLLPDQVLACPDPRAMALLLDAIHGGERAVFLTAAESDPARLAADGALRLERDKAGQMRVADYADKPGVHRAAGFDAVWFAYAFAREHAHEVLGVLHRSTLRPADPVYGNSGPQGLGPLLGALAFDVGPFSDLGTWGAVRAHIAGADR